MEEALGAPVSVASKHRDKGEKFRNPFPTPASCKVSAPQPGLWGINRVAGVSTLMGDFPLRFVGTLSANKELSGVFAYQGSFSVDRFLKSGLFEK